MPFKVFVAWLYTGRIAYESSGSGASSYDDMEKLDIALQEETPYEREEEEDDGGKHNGEDNLPHFDNLSRFDEVSPLTWTYSILGALFVLSDRLDAAKFKRQVLDAMIERKLEGIIPTNSAVLYAYANTTRKCPLRRLLVHIAAYETSYKASYITWNHLPVEYLTAVMVTMGRRLPVQQCTPCLKTALSDNGIASEDLDDVHEKEDLPPYKRDRCFYHEHRDEEETKACREIRENQSVSE